MAVFLPVPLGFPTPSATHTDVKRLIDIWPPMFINIIRCVRKFLSHRRADPRVVVRGARSVQTAGRSRLIADYFPALNLASSKSARSSFPGSGGGTYETGL